MSKEMRRQQRKMKSSEVADLLVNGGYGILSLNGEDDYAYGIPLSYVYVGDSIYFHSAMDGEKLNRVRKNNKVAFCVVGDVGVLSDQFSMNYKSVIVFGKATEVDNNEEKFKALVVFLEKYTPKYVEKGIEHIVENGHVTAIVRLDIDHISGKSVEGESLTFPYQ